MLLLIRHATATKRKDAWDALDALDIDRPETVSFGPDDAQTMLPSLKHEHRIGVPWLLSVRLAGESWIHCIPSNEKIISVEQIARNKRLHVLASWYDPKEKCTHACLYIKGKRAAELVTAGKGEAVPQVISFSPSHAKFHPKDSKSVRELLARFFAAVDANLTDLQVRELNGGIELRGASGRPIRAADIEELGITYYAPLSAAENPAGKCLQEAIESGEVEAVHRAIADGASLEFLPDIEVSPLSIAFDSRYPGDWRGVAKVLVDAGAPINGYGWEDTPLCSVIDSGIKDERRIIEHIKAIRALGADINAPARHFNKGLTPLHLAVQRSLPDVVKFLLDRGAKFDALDADGLTALDLAEQLSRNNAPAESTGMKNEAVDGGGRHGVLTLLEAFAHQFSGTPNERAVRGRRVWKILRNKNSSGNSSKARRTRRINRQSINR